VSICVHPWFNCIFWIEKFRVSSVFNLWLNPQRECIGQINFCVGTADAARRGRIRARDDKAFVPGAVHHCAARRRVGCVVHLRQLFSDGVDDDSEFACNR